MDIIPFIIIGAIIYNILGAILRLVYPKLYPNIIPFMDLCLLNIKTYQLVIIRSICGGIAGAILYAL